ncbi:HD domain-containing protein [uncultured Dubosiella sp.]|uniref:HD domain-containing protein n=1 Tax=uncultured Dubosiella sp. TaxID=1937011 RepID=UPI00259B4325|nr:HD domain-containing protein [uncultured Dubosiella sp.]
MKMRKKEEFRKKIQAHVEHFEQNGRFFQQHNYPHHKHVSVHEHVRHVAYTALKIAHSLKVKVDEDKLIRAALLHDYYLYDWHDDEAWHKFHGFKHPRFACDNAHRDFGLCEREQDAILKHMFPLTIKPPKHREGWLITLADKICAFKECWIKNWSYETTR